MSEKPLKQNTFPLVLALLHGKSPDFPLFREELSFKG